MDIIEHTYTIQWVGPMNYDEYKKYNRSKDTLSPDMFNLYYFEVRQDKRYKWQTYIGIHKENDGINKRLDTQHEHLGPFIKSEAKDIRIWIGSFANGKDQRRDNIDIVETLFIKAYHDKFTINDRKKQKLPDCSVCVINTYYNTKEDPIKIKSDKPLVFDDVLIYLDESNSFMHGNLTKMKGTI